MQDVGPKEQHSSKMNPYVKETIIESEDIDYVAGYYISNDVEAVKFRYRKIPVVDTTPWFAKEPMRYCYSFHRRACKRLKRIAHDLC